MPRIRSWFAILPFISIIVIVFAFTANSLAAAPDKVPFGIDEYSALRNARAVAVAPDGKTVYIFDKDNGTTSACTGSCAAVWPAVTSSGAPSAAPGVDASKLSTATGQAPDQVAYNGHLLYEFKGDTAPGQTNGTKIPGWHDVSAQGTPAS